MNSFNTHAWNSNPVAPGRHSAACTLKGDGMTRRLMSAEQLVEAINAAAMTVGEDLHPFGVVPRERADPTGCNWWVWSGNTVEFKVPGVMEAIVRDLQAKVNLLPSESRAGHEAGQPAERDQRA